MTFTSADLLKFGLAKTRNTVRVGAVKPTSQAAGIYYRSTATRERNLLALPTLDMYLPLSNI